LKKIFYILCLSFSFAGQLEVDGDLTVTGQIQSTTIDSLLQVIADLQAQLITLEGENRFETRLFELNRINVSDNLIVEIDLESITGSILGFAKISFGKVIDFNLSGTTYLSIETLSGDQENSSWDSGPGIYFQGNQGGEPNYHWSGLGELTWGGESPIRIVFGGSSTGFVDLSLLITAQFPESNIQLRKTDLQSKDKK